MNYLSIKIIVFLFLSVGMSAVNCSPVVLLKSNSNNNIAGQIMHYQPQGIIAKSLPEIALALKKGEISSEALVRLYLERINLVDKNGPTLQAVLSLNPNVIADAKTLDAMKAGGEVKGPLHGIPLLLKDNIETKDPLATTAGALALKDNITGRDSPLVAGLRNAGAIILGKTNLSQWANFRSESSMSGWSALGGQVRNPHMLDRNPCGSSSGSGAATAASLAAGTVGTETNGSVICPSNANGIVGFKPTVGLVPQDFIIPISVSQDTAGPMTKTVQGAAMMMNAMATQAPDIDFTAGLSLEALKGVRVGVLQNAVGQNTEIKKHFEVALTVLEKAGAMLVKIDSSAQLNEDFENKSYELLKYEFKDGLNTYLASTSHEQVKTRTLNELIHFNELNAETELALFDQSIFEASQAIGSVNDNPKYTKLKWAVQNAARREGIDKILKDHDVRVLVAPSGPIVPRVDPANGDVWPSFPGAGSMAAIAGYPHVTVPMGSVRSLSVGLSFIGGKNDDADILSYAYAYEQRSRKRLEPNYYADAEELPEVAKAMKPYSSEKISQ